MDLLKVLSRKSDVYEVDGVRFNLNEMSAKQQMEWSETTESGDMVDKYAQLVKSCCDELKDCSLDDIKEISATHLIAMGNKVIELSSTDEKKD